MDIKTAYMKGTRHPNLILGLISFLLLFVGVGMRANGYQSGIYVLAAALFLGVIHWLWSIIDVFRDYRVNSGSENRIIWVILVVIIPPLGGILYYSMSKTVRM
jgi:hypothetical protein